MKIFLWVSVLVVFSTLFRVSNRLALAAEPPLRTITFTEDATTNFPNPERGWTHAMTFSSDLSRFSSYRASGITMVDLAARADSYRNSDLPQSFLDQIKAGLNAARNAGLKVSFAFAYNACNDKGNSACADAPKSIVFRHIDQLKPIFEANSDVISTVLAGWIGAWGEWHASTNGLSTTANRRDILFRILSTVPADRTVSVRSPVWELPIYNQQELTEAEAFTGTNNARTGHYNDCFLTTEMDYGTYDQNFESDTRLNSNYDSVQELKAYVSRETKYVPISGETCAVYQRSHCATAITEMPYLHWSYLNQDFDRSVLDIWKNEGCYDEITRRMGYRFVLQNIQAPSQVKPGGVLELRFNLKNVGYASPYNSRLVEIILENTSTGQKYSARVNQDPRRWLPEKNPIQFSTQLRIPANIATGTYKLHLNLPDPYTSLHDRPEYSIRLANNNTWVATNGYNQLLSDLSITTAAPGVSEPNDNSFHEINSNLPSPTPNPTGKTGDINSDNKVDIIDIGILIDVYGMAPSVNPKADINKDGKIDIVDVGIVIDNYGS